MCIGKCIFSDEINFMVHTPFKAAELLGDNPVRVPGQVQQPEGGELETQVGKDCKVPQRTRHKQDPEARAGGQQD